MLTRRAIKALMDAGLIKVTPEPLKVGPNSIDLRLGDSLRSYKQPEFSDSKGLVMEWQHPDVLHNRVVVKDPVSGRTYYALDPKNPPPLEDVPKLEDGGWLLVPGQFYLGVTMEETFCKGVIPHLDGRSTCGRLSIEAHKTAGVGDNGFRGRWTLEIEVTEPVIVRPGDRLFQVYFSPAWGEGLALLIQSMQAPQACEDAEEPTVGSDLHVSLGRLQDGDARLHGPLFELLDLYGEGGGHHYQGSTEARAPEPLD